MDAVYCNPAPASKSFLPAEPLLKHCIDKFVEIPDDFRGYLAGESTLDIDPHPEMISINTEYKSQLDTLKEEGYVPQNYQGED